MLKHSFEVCIDSVKSAQIAEGGGAHRLELCANLHAGGTTPSLGLIKQCKRVSKLPIRVMIRPRGGDFLYSTSELQVMEEDIKLAIDAGADGLVFGLLTEGGEVDKQHCARLIELAQPIPCTFHRAFDMTQDPIHALHDIMNLGFDMILTSGQEANVIKGADLIKKLVAEAGQKIRIMAGAGIKENNVSELISQTGVQHIHASASHSIPSHMKYRNPRLSMGVEGYDEFSLNLTSKSKVAKILEQANKAWKSGNF